MTNSFLIGSVLNALITNNEEIKKHIDNRCYPLVAAEGTQYPFIVYHRLNSFSNGCKDGYYEDSVDFSITILATTYSQSITIAQLVRGILERQKIHTELLDMYDTHVTGISEEFSSDTYIQIINFKTKIN